MNEKEKTIEEFCGLLKYEFEESVNSHITIEGISYDVLTNQEAIDIIESVKNSYLEEEI